jgi:hypothetical protein
MSARGLLDELNTTRYLIRPQADRDLESQAFY